MDKTVVPRDLLAELRALRRDLHRHPELGFRERRTARIAAEFVKKLGLEVTEGVGGTGVVALLRGKRGGRTVGLRADMDALPIQEETGLPYASETEGCMHACGHDGHVAILLGTAAFLSRTKDRLPGNVKFIVQPAEEAGSGAESMIEAGVLRNPKVDAIFGLHCWPELPVGQIGIRYGTLAASADEFTVTVLGKGCHAASPHKGVDPVYVAAKIIDNLQGVISRERNPLDAAVITVGMIHGGTAPNRIPDEVILRGTVRALTEETRREVLTGLRRVIRTTARTFRARVRLKGSHGGISPVVNHPAATDILRAAGESALGKGNVIVLDRPSMGAEDFSEYLRHVPGSYFRLGMQRRGDKSAISLHMSRLNFNDAAILPGIRIMSAVARRFLESPRGTA